MFKLKKKILALATVLVVGAFGLVGCSNDKNETTKDEPTKIVLVLDKGGVQDESFNQSAWTGAIKAKEELGVEVKYLESVTDTDYAQNIETAIDMGSDLIIGIGFNLSQAIEEAAISYPEQQFAIIDGSFEKIPDNVTSILFNEKEAGYLAGIVAAATDKNSNKFGFVGGFEVPAVVNYKEGFEQGIKEVNPNAELYTQYANSFTDASKGRVIAQQMVSQGVEKIMTAGGGVNAGVYEVCSEKGKHAIAVDMAQSNISPETILTSAIKKVDVGIYETIKSYIGGNLKGGISHMHDISNNGVGYEDTKLLTDEVRQLVNEKISK